MVQTWSMPARRLTLGFAVALAFGAAQPRAGQAPPSSPRAALFTEAQAAGGEALYRQSCAACHGVALTGGTAPALTGPAFEASWSDPRVTLADVFFLARTSMPPRASSSLTAQDHAAVFAYILKVNGFPPGPTPLTAASEQLEAAHLRPAGAGAPARAPAPEFVPGAAGSAPAASGPDQATLTASAQSTDWLFHTHDYAGTRFSPLADVNTATAAHLVPACMFQVGERDNFQTGPIVYNGTMYVTTMISTVALDAATCRVKWRHRWQTRDDLGFQRNRGIAIKDGRVLRGTPDGYLIALNADTGAPLWARQVAKPSEGETFTMAPVVFEDLVLIGPAGSENNLQGWVGAFRASDGSPVWRFNTIPKRGEPGFETWKNPKGIPMGGGAVWTAFALDTASGDLHIAVTNPSPDLPVHLRQGDNLYTNSIVVLDVRTGKLRWHRQLVPNDSHDWDVTHATPMVNTTINGAPRRLVITTGKDGMLRALDRETHAVVYETPVTTRENADTPVITTPLRACPGVLGGSQWNGPAYNPGTNTRYAPAVDWCATFSSFEQVRYIPGKLYMGGRTDLDPVDKSQGWLTAVDASSGAVKWKYRSARPMVAAVTTTAGNVVMTGELNGDFVVFDARSGDVLYRFNTGGPVGGGVVTYRAGGKQYVAVASGSPSNFWVERNPGAPTIVVFTLPSETGADVTAAARLVFASLIAVSSAAALAAQTPLGRDAADLRAHMALLALDRYLETWNSRDPERWSTSLNFPHVRPGPGAFELFRTPAQYAASVNFAQTLATGWHHSEWTTRRVLQIGVDKVHVAGSWLRYTEDGRQMVGTSVTYIVTNQGGRWGVLSRFAAGPTGLEPAAAAKNTVSALETVRAYFQAWNGHDPRALGTALHYPHVRIGDGAVEVWNAVADFLAGPEPGRQRTCNETRLDQAEVVQVSANGVNVAVTYSRRDRAGDVMSKYEAVFLVVRRDDAWKVQAISTMGT